MTDRNERLKSIKERLEAATPGPWRMGSLSSYNAATGEPEAFVYRLDSKDERETYHNRICVRGHEDAMDCDADAEFIANAPSDIGYLLALVERYEKALEFYANLKNWRTVTVSNKNQRFCIMTGADLEYFQEPNQDSYCGKRAREALEAGERE